MNEMYMRLTDILEDEISKIVKDGEVTEKSLCHLDTLVDVVKDIHEITAMAEREDGYSGYRGVVYDNNGYSGRMNYSMANDGRGNGNGYDNRYYDDRRDGRRYMTYEGDMRYSGHEDKNKMISLMEEAMALASTQEERDEIMKMIKKMDK